jgi:molybdopterin converting factor small subunit
MQTTVHFYSYFKDLTGCQQATESLPEGSTLEDLLKLILARFPKLAPMRNSMLLAVGLEYQDSSYLLKEGDEVSLFPPVQGG